jgi:DNA polymerase elongation subunit (family B)
MSNPGFVFDIETHPNDLTPEMEALLNHKVRNVAEENKEIEKLRYRFRLPAYSRMTCISTLYDVGDGIEHKYEFMNKENEKGILSAFIEYITQWNGRYIHFNGLDFDVPYILFKCAQYEIDPPQRFCNLIRFRTDPHYDIMQVLSAWGKFPISLAEAALSFNVPNSKDELQGTDTLNFLLTASDADILKYNKADVKTTYELFKKVYKVYR